MSGRKKRPRGPRQHRDEEYGVLKHSEMFHIERLLPGPIERVWSYLTYPERRRKCLAAGQWSFARAAAWNCNSNFQGCHRRRLRRIKKTRARSSEL